MKIIFFSFWCCLVTNLALAQEMDQLETLGINETIEYIEKTANEFIATPFIELLKDDPDYQQPNCLYSFKVSQLGELIVDRHCDSKDLSNNDLQWSAFLKRLEISELDCRDYDVEKSLNYVYVSCSKDRDYCFTKTKDHKINVSTMGMAIYVSNKDAASLIHRAFTHLLNIAYEDPDFKSKEPN